MKHRKDLSRLNCKRIFILAIVFQFAFLSVMPASVHSKAKQAKPARTAPSRAEIIAETNKARKAHDLKPLRENPILNRMAEERVDDMFWNQYFGHTSPSGEPFEAFSKRVGYRYRLIGENLGNIYPNATSRKFVEGWMHSPGHRKNILNRNFREIGVAVKKGKLDGQNTWIAVQIFGTKL